MQKKWGKMLPKLMQLCSPFANKKGLNAPKINATSMEIFFMCRKKGAKCSQSNSNFYGGIIHVQKKRGKILPKLMQLLCRNFSCAEKKGQNAPKINANSMQVFFMCRKKGAKYSQN